MIGLEVALVAPPDGFCLRLIVVCLSDLLDVLYASIGLIDTWQAAAQ